MVTITINIFNPFSEDLEQAKEEATRFHGDKRDELASWHFDVFLYTEEMLIPFTVIMFRDLNLLTVMHFKHLKELTLF